MECLVASAVGMIVSAPALGAGRGEGRGEGDRRAWEERVERMFAFGVDERLLVALALDLEAEAKAGAGIGGADCRFILQLLN